MKKIIFLFFIFSVLFYFNSKLYAQLSKPNIILILTDDLGYGDVSSFNSNSLIQTKNIDLLAKKGMRFTDAHSNSSVCTPTRYGIMTGRYAWRSSLQSGVLWSYDSLLIKKDRLTIATLLKENGYNTACIGKWHLGLDWKKDSVGNVNILKGITRGPTDVGFNYFYGINSSLDIPPYVYIENKSVTAKSIDSIDGRTGKGFWRAGPIGNDFNHSDVLSNLINHASKFIREESNKKNPFFLYLPLPSPHTPILPSKEYLGKSGTNEYGDFVLMTDDMIGKLIKAVVDVGIENNTVIIFTSDNGCSPSANFDELAAIGHNPSSIYRGAKSDIFEGGHRIPFIIKWPGRVVENSVSNRTICLTDIFATFCGITHHRIKDNEGEDSYSLLPLIFNLGTYKRKSIIHHSIDGNFAIRKNNWKLEFCAGSGGWSMPDEKLARVNQLPLFQLYDIKSDPQEKINKYGIDKNISSRLKKLTIRIIDNGRSTKGKTQKNDVEVKLIKPNI